MQPFFSDYLKSLETLFGDFSDLLEGLPQEALDWRPGADTSSLAVLAVHTAGSTRYRLGEVCLGEPPTRDRPGEFRTADMDAPALQALLQDTVEHARQSLAQLEMDDLSRIRPVPGRGMEVSVAQARLQALEHGSQELGHAQITLQMWRQRARS